MGTIDPQQEITMSEVTAPVAAKVDEIIGKYIELRDSIERETKALAAKLEPLQAAQKGIETYLMALAVETGQTQFGTKSGTAFITTKTGCNIADRDAYWDFLMQAPAERRNLLTLSANKTAVGEYIDANNTTPPGINWTVMKAIQIRRS